MKKTIQLLPILLISFLSFPLFAQTAQKTKIKLSGSAALYNDYYHLKSDTTGAVLPRRPTFQSRFVANLSLSYKKIALPFSCTIVPGNTSFFYPELPLQGFKFKNIKSIISNPMNRIGIAPKYKHYQLFLGSQLPNYSELSLGDLSVFGIGVAITPKHWSFSAVTGSTQIAINRDSLHHIDGNYKRKLSAVKLGFGAENSTQLYFVFAKIFDDTSSVLNRPLSSMPVNGIVSTLGYRINLSKSIFFSNEIAGSAFTRNTFNSEISNPLVPLPKFLFVTRTSSRFDYASIATLGKEGTVFGIKLVGKYYGDGFAPVGFPFMQTDRMDLTIDPKFSSKNHKIQFNGSFGKRVNNLLGMRGIRTAQTIGMLNLNIQFSKAFSVSSNVSNFGYKNAISNDTFRLETTTWSWTVSPSLNLVNDKRSHTFNLLFSQNNYLDLNLISGALNNNNSQNIGINYFYLKFKNQLGFTALSSYFNNINVSGKMETFTANAGVAYAFLKNKLNVNTGIARTVNTFNNTSSGKQWFWNIGARYKLNKKINFGLNGSINLYKYGFTRPGIAYRETLIRSSINYKF